MSETYDSPKKDGGPHTNKTNPRHYKGVIIHGVEVQPADVIEAYFIDDGLLSQAGKYILRHGKKEGNSYIDDVGKALWWCARALLSRGGYIDLPPGSEEHIRVNGQPVIVTKQWAEPKV